MLCKLNCNHIKPIINDGDFSVVSIIPKGTLFETISISDSFIKLKDIMCPDNTLKIATEEFTDILDILEEGL